MHVPAFSTKVENADMKVNVQFASPQSAVRNVARCPSVRVFHLTVLFVFEKNVNHNKDTLVV